MMIAAVLDAVAFDVIDSADGAQLRYLLRNIVGRGGEVRCSAVTLAEVCQGRARTRRAEVAVSRDRGGKRVLVVPTDERLAKLVGAILHATSRSSDAMADAHVVAACAGAEAAIVITSDPHDIAALATAIPGTRVTTRHPRDIASG
jgi:predicted nucleic acid-binding protein